MKRTRQMLYVSATPARFELFNSRVANDSYTLYKRDDSAPPVALPRISPSSELVEQFDVSTPGAPLIVEQIIRPTGLLDPVLTLKPLKGQIDETIELCRQRVERKQRVLVTTLTKRTAEDLTDYLRGLNLSVRYIHADVNAIERVEILRGLRAGEFDILVGINLLREGLDLPEVSLVCILDADKEGYLRSETSLVQTAGRAARHTEGEVVLFCDQVTKSIQALIGITEYHRRVQSEYNTLHNVVPTSTQRGEQEGLRIAQPEMKSARVAEGEDEDVEEVIRQMQAEMVEASQALEFERAALLRDQIRELKSGGIPSGTVPKKVNYRDALKKPRRAGK